MKRLFKYILIIMVFSNFNLRAFADNNVLCNSSSFEIKNIGDVIYCLKDVNEISAKNIFEVMISNQSSFGTDELTEVLIKLKPFLAKKDYLFYSRYDVDDESNLKKLQEASELGSREAPFWIWYLKRYDKEGSAEQFLKLSAERGFSEGEREYGVLLTKSPDSLQLGLQYLEKAALQGNDQARKSLLYFSKYLSKNQIEFWNVVDSFYYENDKVGSDESILSRLKKVSSWKSFCKKIERSKGLFSDLNDSYKAEQMLLIKTVVVECLTQQ